MFDRHSDVSKAARALRIADLAGIAVRLHLGGDTTGDSRWPVARIFILENSDRMPAIVLADR